MASGDGPDVDDQDKGTYVYEVIDIFSHTLIYGQKLKFRSNPQSPQCAHSIITSMTKSLTKLLVLVLVSRISGSNRSLI